MSEDTFTEKIEIVDSWKGGSDKYRLVYKGAGPMELQILKGDKWSPESQCYIHSTLCHRIKDLTLQNNDIKEIDCG